MRSVYAAMVVVHLAAPLGVLAPTPAAAQQPDPACDVRGSPQWLSSRLSPLDSATIVVRGVIAKICYSRPSARGRSVDSLVPLGRAWRTGANEPTTITLTGTLNVGGATLEPGRYVILTVPQAEQWILVFHTTPETEPAKMFKSLEQVAQGVGRVERLDRPVEQFTMRSAPDSTERAILLEWGERRVRVPVRAVP